MVAPTKFHFTAHARQRAGERRHPPAFNSQVVFTDRLIDEIVCRRHGLTPEEIQIVEGGARE